MINFEEEIKRFKPSLDVDNIEEMITGIDLTDMGDLMMQLAQIRTMKIQIQMLRPAWETLTRYRS